MLKELSYKSPERRKADGILAWHPNRLSRNALEAGMIVQMLDDELIQNLYFASYSFHNDTSGKEHLTIEFARAKGYNDQLSDVVSRGILSRERMGAMVSSRKFGYQAKREHSDPKLCSMFPIPDLVEYPAIQRMFELALQ